MCVAKKCLLDMDEVLVDFVGGACKLHGKPWPYDKVKGSQGWGIASVLGMSEEEFWSPFDEKFWRELQPTPFCSEVIAMARRFFGHDNVALLSSPTHNHGCVPGKLQWIDRHIPTFNSRYLFGPAKHFAAGPHTVLIDDSQANVRAFLEHGGNAFLVPRPWNDSWQDEPRLLELLEEYLDALFSEDMNRA